MGLFGPGWKNKDKQKALRWIEKQPANSPALMAAAECSGDADLREAAVKRITSPLQLEQLARAYCVEAVLAIRDPGTLYAIAEKPAFFDGEDRTVESRVLLAVDPKFGRISDPWNISLDVPADNARLLDIRRWEKRFGLADLAFQQLVRMKEDALLEKLMYTSRYDTIRRYAVLRAMDSGQEQAARLAADRKLAKELRKTVIEKITDPEIRRQYCGEFDTHSWELVSEKRTPNGDHLDISSEYRCRFCGRERREDERIRL